MNTLLKLPPTILDLSLLIKLLLPPPIKLPVWLAVFVSAFPIILAADKLPTERLFVVVALLFVTWSNVPTAAAAVTKISVKGVPPER